MNLKEDARKIFDDALAAENPIGVLVGLHALLMAAHTSDTAVYHALQTLAIDQLILTETP